MKRILLSILTVIGLCTPSWFHVSAAESVVVVPLKDPHVCGSEALDTSERVSLAGNGFGCLEGHGIVGIRVERGLVGIAGTGILAFRATTYELEGDWKYGVQEVMGWHIVMGSGSYLARGSDRHEVVGWLVDEARVKYRGELNTTFEGMWTSVSEKLVESSEVVSLTPFTE